MSNTTTIVGYAAIDRADGKPSITPVTQADIDAGGYDPNNHYPDAGTALHPIVDRLWGQVVAMEPKARAWDDLLASSARIEARLALDPDLNLPGDPDEFGCSGCGTTKTGTFCSACGTRRAD